MKLCILLFASLFLSVYCYSQAIEVLEDTLLMEYPTVDKLSYEQKTDLRRHDKDIYLILDDFLENKAYRKSIKRTFVRQLNVSYKENIYDIALYDITFKDNVLGGREMNTFFRLKKIPLYKMPISFYLYYPNTDHIIILCLSGINYYIDENNQIKSDIGDMDDEKTMCFLELVKDYLCKFH
jgi:hypothetical protein